MGIPIANTCTIYGHQRCWNSGGTSEGCKGCGWICAEIKRRKRLPLFRDERGLWRKHVGRRKSTQND